MKVTDITIMSYEYVPECDECEIPLGYDKKNKCFFCQNKDCENFKKPCFTNKIY